MNLSSQVSTLCRGSGGYREALTCAQDEIFVYDRVLFTIPESQPRATSPEIPVPDLFTPRNPPASLSDQGNLRSWQTLFKERKQWATGISKQTDKLFDEIHTYDSQANVIQRATIIASERLKQNTSGLQEKYTKAKSWVDETLQEPKLIIDDFKDSVSRLGRIEANAELLSFFRPPGSQESSLPKTKRLTLRTLVDTGEAQHAVSRATDAIRWLEKQTVELGAGYEDLLQSCTVLVQNALDDFSALDGGGTRHTIESLSEEVEAVVNKIGTDCETALSSPDNQRSISSLSRVASHHTHNLLPSLIDTAKDISELLQRTIQRRNDSQTLALQTMQKISLSEVRFADLQSGIGGLGIDDEDDRLAFEILSFIAALPAMYASLLCEVVRRREWAEKMMADSSTLAEEMATHKDDEERRRSKWFKGLQDYLHPEVIESKALDVDVNLKNQSTTWPKLTRKDITAYDGLLRSLCGYDAVLQDINEQLKSLDGPSKQQIRRSNAFRNGSIHEAAYGRQSLLLRGDDELITALQGDKSRLEDRLKGSESRIRKLEDLLHRQSQTSRGPASSPRHSMDRTATSPVLHQVGLASPKGAQDGFSKHSSASSRRVSGNYGPEERSLAQRVVQLEYELASERSKAVQNQDHMRTQEDLKLQVQEATSTKKDLMENFTAQQVEFDGERRLFIEENRKLKMRLEEMEEEVDRLLGSNDNAKLGLDERAQAHEDEISKIRKESSDEVQRIQGQIDFLRNEYAMQREKAYNLERKVQAHEDEKRTLDVELIQLREEIRRRDQEREEHHKSLLAIFSDLSYDGTPPEGFNDLMEEAETLGRKASSHLQDLKVAMDSIRADSTSYQEQARNYENELQGIREQRESEAEAASELREELDTEKARFKSLETELSDERKDLASLREKLSDGESGPEALRNRISVEERKASDLGMEVATLSTQVQRLEESLATTTEELKSLHRAKQSDEHTLLARAQRAEKVSVLLFSHTDRLTHLLEHIGYSVTRQNDSMVIQRLPRMSTSSTAAVDQSQLMGRSLSGPVAKATEAPPDYIHWALSKAGQEESHFNAFLRESEAFKMDAFSEAIIKRIKDTEHIARKWQREAKSYRDKFHRAQFESQNKIAFRTFRDGDLALFLPTRNTAPNQRSWAAFNVGAPHYFLREQEFHKLNSRDWLLARISKIEERIVDLSKSDGSLKPLPSTYSLEEDNPFGLSDGLRWYFLDAAEEKLGAPSTPGLGKTTVASAHVDAAGSIQRKKEADDGGVTRTLAKSLDSRRSSDNSKKSLLGATASPVAATAHVEGACAGATSSSLRTTESAQEGAGSVRPSPSKSSIPEEVRNDQLLGP